MRFLFALLGLLFLMASPASAYDTPEALVEALYAPYLSGQVPQDQAVLRSLALQSHYDADAARTPEGEMGALDFDPLVDGQDFDLGNFLVTATEVADLQATVEVSFSNLGAEKQLRLFLVREVDGWKLDDVQSLTSGRDYQLTALLWPRKVFDDAVFADPGSVVETLYSPYPLPYEDFDWQSWDESQLRSAGLNALYEKDRIESAGNIGRLDFDPYVNGQDYLVTDVVIGEPAVAGHTASVKVSLSNFDRPMEVTFYLVREDGRWKIDDMENFDPEYPYRLRAILEAPLDAQ